MHCPRCTSDDFTEINIDIKVDNSVKFLSCRLCEKKWWERNGASIALDEVLSIATVVRSR